MFLEVVRSESLSHLSFLVGDGGRAAVIDPRRDCGIYMDLARRAGARITCILETHRHEDFLTGSKELSLLTAASVYHGGKSEFRFGNPALEGDIFELGGIRLTVIETPGHTPESVSYALAETRFSDSPIAVFTGDTLHVGGTGRTDLFPGREHDAAGQLYDSIFNRLLPLGDHVVIYPAHYGAGSADNTSGRCFSTLGFERRYNNSLRPMNRDAFIASKAGERRPLPPFCSLMLRRNLEGPPIMNGMPQPQPYLPDDFTGAISPGLFVVDTRSPEAVCGSYIPGSLALPLDRISEFAGWFIPYDSPIGLVVESSSLVQSAVSRLVRVGFDAVQAYLVNSAYAWGVSGRSRGCIPATRISGGTHRRNVLILDVRTPGEYALGSPAGAVNLFLGDIPERIPEIPRDRGIVVWSGNDDRAVIAASVLRMNGVESVEIGLGTRESCVAPECVMATT